MEKGYLALVLHAHLPYVHHPEREHLLEERWLFEAISESYLPLLEVFEGLVRDGVKFRVTMSLTPTLLSMLASPLLQERYTAFLDNLIGLAEKETARTRAMPPLDALSAMYVRRFRQLRERFVRRYRGNIISAFAELQTAGALELITSAATHAFLPYVKTDQAVRAQIEQAIKTHTACIGVRPRGIWLPECGYKEGLDAVLRDCGIAYFLTDTHAVAHMRPKPANGVYAPVATAAGVAAFARDFEASKQVWSAAEGYPGDADYREYYRDIGYDLDEDDLRPYLHPEGIRLHTGIKYHRITGPTSRKEWYDPARAADKAAEHAGHFMFNRERQAEHLAARMERKPLITASYDAELFGHWWYEGPRWIDFLCRKIHRDQRTIRMLTPAEYLRAYPQNQQGELSFSSWGRGGYGEVWLGARNEWIYRHLHAAEEEMLRAAARPQPPSPLERRALNQMTRELMLAQSSDWAFIIDSDTMVDYAVKRIKTHLARFGELRDMLLSGRMRESRIRQMEAASPIFPDADYRAFRPSAGAAEIRSGPLPAESAADAAEVRSARAPTQPAAGSVRVRSGPLPAQPSADAAEVRSARAQMQLAADAVPPRSTPPAGPAARLKVLMLSWEYPPMMVGGLSEHVFHLSRALVEQGIEVHVITSCVRGYPRYELNQRVHVHRVGVYQPAGLDFAGLDFMEWVFQLNLAMVDCGRSLIAYGGPFHLLHAHDWLVCRAAKALKHQFGLPLAATLHATEHGRNPGLHTKLQRRIHHLEWELSYEAQRVICCSRYMEREIGRLFGLPADKIEVIANGVDERLLCEREPDFELRGKFARPDEQIVLFVGRMVREKGAHILLDSIPAILEQCGRAKFVLVGKGPMLDEWKRRAEELGIAGKILFTGFIDDEEKRRLFRLAAVAVFPSLYEPFGIVALEAMAAGAPLIVSDVGGLREVVRHGVDGYAVPPGDAHALAVHAVKILKDRQAARAMAARARGKAAAVYDWSRIAQRTADTYDDMLHAAEISLKTSECSV